VEAVGDRLVGFLVVGMTAPQPEQQAVTPNSSPNLSGTTSEQPADSVVDQPSQQSQQQEVAKNEIVEDFKTLLPPENRELAAFILADAWLNGFLENVWIGNATSQDLLKRGFYVNNLYKHTGNGEEPQGEPQGACSPIGFNGSFMCGRGAAQPHQWGIQSDKVIDRLNVLEEEWAVR
jgi:hypothetical protein